MTDKKKFIILMIAFLFFALIIPIVYLAIRFKLFEETTKTTLSFWAIIIIALVFIVVSVLIKYYISGLKTRYSYLKQILSGIVKVILPLVLIVVGVILFKRNAEVIVSKLNIIIEALCVILCSETIAVFVNPLPKWAFENNVEGIKEIADKIFKKGETE